MRQEFAGDGDPMRFLRGVGTLLIEFCASKDSELTKNVPYGFAALRIMDKEDFTNQRTLQAVLDIIYIAKNNDVKIIVWLATPCASGCPWKHVNAASGFSIGDRALFYRPIKHADKVCRLAQLLGGD